MTGTLNRKVSGGCSRMNEKHKPQETNGLNIATGNVCHFADIVVGVFNPRTSLLRLHLPVVRRLPLTGRFGSP
jgi:hypothetical protein